MNVGSRPLRKTVVFFLAVTIMALGVILSTKAVLGTSPISSIPYVLSLGIHMSIGLTMFIINLIMVAFGILMMGRLYKPIYLFQIVMVVMFSALCDVFSYIVDWIVLTNYIVQWGMVILAAVVLSFGISLELAANVTMMPGEYLVSFVSIRTGVEFGKVKVLFDITMISIAIVASFFFFGALNGIREGTIFAAVSIGFIVRFFTKFLKDSGFYDWLGHKDISMIRNVKTPEELQ
ncbi:MAG: DUF6198 family protein [Candidatus Methanogranum gryphiswaldense]|nr:MAG: DUF6198 family protein [Candidatus Methanogranum sp. U3.2.1]